MWRPLGSSCPVCCMVLYCFRWVLQARNFVFQLVRAMGFLSVPMTIKQFNRFWSWKYFGMLYLFLRSWHTSPSNDRFSTQVLSRNVRLSWNSFLVWCFFKKKSYVTFSTSVVPFCLCHSFLPLSNFSVNFLLKSRSVLLKTSMVA